MWNDIKRNPVRCYSVCAAALVLVVFYVPGLPVPAVMGLLAALFGLGGEAVRNNVTPAASPQTTVPVPLVPAVAAAPVADQEALRKALQDVLGTSQTVTVTR